MSHRTFTDSDGVEVEVWDVIPRGVVANDGPERRQAQGTRRAANGGERGEPRDEERRSGFDRRSMHVAPAMRGGWLAFQSAAGKRRLAPIPPGWADAPEPRLEELCRLAQPVAGNETGRRA